MELSFEDHAYNKVLNKIGFSGAGMKVQLGKVLIPFAICWLPLAVMTLINRTFWTGEITTSFITNFDTQARLLISMPIFIMAEKLISTRLEIILRQFINSGIIVEEEKLHFEKIIKKQSRFLKSNWTDLAVFLISYLQVFVVLFYESTNTSFFSWQMLSGEGESAINLAGKWSALISRPFFLFLFYRWMLRIIVWGNILRKISKLNIRLYPEHPDLAGGLGYLGYAIRYFSPIAFAISAGVAGTMADFMLIEGLHIADLKVPALGYFIFISLLFTIPLLSFTGKLINARESSVFDNYDFANGMYRELRMKIAKGYELVTKRDLDSAVYSAVSDYNAVVDNILKMKFLPFTLKDMIPLWIMTALPFLAVIALEIPVAELLNKLLSILV
jgi:hypothetical protein